MGKALLDIIKALFRIAKLSLRINKENRKARKLM